MNNWHVNEIFPKILKLGNKLQNYIFLNTVQVLRLISPSVHY